MNKLLLNAAETLKGLDDFLRLSVRCFPLLKIGFSFKNKGSRPFQPYIMHTALVE